MNHSVLETIEKTFNKRGKESYGIEPVTQLQHALQCALMAEEAQATNAQVVASLLHDIGHIMHDDDLPDADTENYDDRHEEKAYEWLLENFGAAVADPVRLHVNAKRYLCTIDQDYEKKLTPTSYKSFLDQGGYMGEEELNQFKREPFYQEAVQLRIWDDLAKDSEKVTPDLNHYLPTIAACLKIN